jgi:hypothetical protein
MYANEYFVKDIYEYKQMSKVNRLKGTVPPKFVLFIIIENRISIFYCIFVHICINCNSVMS